MLRPRCTIWLFLLTATACAQPGTGDDLPPGAFTSGPEDDGIVPDGDTTSSAGVTTSDVATDPGESTGPVDLSHEEHIRPIWSGNCTDSDCHDPDNPAGFLDLASDGVYDRLCDGFHSQTGMRYIDCEGHDPQSSYVFRKLEGTHTTNLAGNGGPMPPSGSLGDALLGTIEAWITSGAAP